MLLKVHGRVVDEPQADLREYNNYLMDEERKMLVKQREWDKKEATKFLYNDSDESDDE